MSQDYRKLEVWRVAHDNALAVYRAALKFPADERYGLTSQLKRAATSVPTNIAEGCGRTGMKEILRFIRIAQGSNAEAAYLVHLSRTIWDCWTATLPWNCIED